MYLTLHYEAPATARPFVFNDSTLDTPSLSTYLIYQKKEEDWKHIPENHVSGPRCFFLAEDWPSRRKLDFSSGCYLCLRPGESREVGCMLYDVDDPDDTQWFDRFPKDMKAGDKFQIRYLGAEILWWDWGTEEEHTETELWLMNGRFLEENGLRPRLFVPGCSVDVEARD